MDSQGKEGSFLPVFVAMLISLVIASMWDKFPAIKEAAHAVLNPTAGALLNWNLTLGMAFLVLVISVFMTLLQKYATDQKTMREMKVEQKRLADEADKFKDHPEKYMAMQKESMKFAIPMMKLGMRPIMYSAIPIILFFRWFMDYFAVLGEFRFFGFLSWFWFYLIASIIFSSVLRKVMNVV